ncbi:MAG: DUF1194 domain-containing protein [Hyphomicrobiaceae bacterium]|nr:DUF1194 domain-containing protein [Hyphomicrobiaceae bacterium]
MLVVSARPALADDVEVDLELVLAVDVSLSMDSFEQKMQLQGYVDAFRDPTVLRAIETGLHKKIAVVFVEWGGMEFQSVKVPWTLIDGEASAEKFAELLGRRRLTALPLTSISTAILFSAALFEDNGFKGDRRVIDVSGDGPNNQGVIVTRARDVVVKRGITVNGLPVMLRVGQAPGFFDLEKLDIYYEDCVIGGPGAFIVPVHEEKNFANAIRRKLIREISGAPAKIMRVQAAPWKAPPRIDCLIGEKLWNEWLGYQD